MKKILFSFLTLLSISTACHQPEEISHDCNRPECGCAACTCSEKCICKCDK